MKIDWCKDTGKWNIRSISTDALIAKAKSLRIEVPTEFITTDGGRHGFAIAVGELHMRDGNAVIRSKSDGESD